MRLMGWLLLLLLGLGTRVAHAESDLPQRRWSVGLQVNPVDLPAGHLGIPLQGSEQGFHLAVAWTARLALARDWAVTAGLGVPHSGMGPAVWLGQELAHGLWTDSRRIVALVLYGGGGLQLGFAGPDFFARHGGTFVGYAYAYGGPLAFALRVPVGLRINWWEDRFDTYVEGTSLLAFTPSVEPLFSLVVGVRIHF